MAWRVVVLLVVALDPRFLDIERWSSQTAALLLPYGFVFPQATEENWHQWGEQLKNIPVMAAAHVPSPGLYDDWRLWAHRVNERLFSLGL